MKALLIGLLIISACSQNKTANEPVFPNASPPQINTANHGFFGRKVYRRTQENGKWLWIYDDEATKNAEDDCEHYVAEKKHKKDLILALRTRVLTEEEFNEVTGMGVNLIDDCPPLCFVTTVTCPTESQEQDRKAAQRFVLRASTN